MMTITRKRVLRPSTRESESLYRVKTEGVGPNDKLELIISDENNQNKPIGIYEFSRKDIWGKSRYILWPRK